jgi:UPF0271 protein
VRVLDAPAFVRDYRPEGDVASVPAVRDELDGTAASRFEAVAGGELRVHDPRPEAVERVRRAARATGDDGVLSDADRQGLAAALELDATLVTDDYAMQNVAARLELDTEPVARDGIDEQREWRFRCEGCGRTFDDDRDRCPICGSGLSRTAP